MVVPHSLVAFTAASASANYWHGRQVGGEQAALYLGGMSIAVAVVFALALRQIRHEDRRRAGTVTDRLPRFSMAHWARYPGLTWQAWSLAVRDGHTSPRTALDAALSQRRAPAIGASPAATALAAATATEGGSDARLARPQKRQRAATRAGQQKRSQADIEASALEVLSRDPGISGADLGRAIGASPRTGQRLLATLGNRASEASA
jgi:hypothetical protein